MARSDDLDKLPLPKGWPGFAKKAVCTALSFLKAAFDIELGRRLDCASRYAREHAEHERLRLDIERFNRTLKYEGLCQDRSAPLGPAGHHHDSRFAMVGWERGVPHAARTVLINEVYFDREPAIEKPRWEPRARWPRTSGCAAPYVPVKGECGARLELEVRYLKGRKHLPVFRLREAA